LTNVLDGMTASRPIGYGAWNQRNRGEKDPASPRGTLRRFSYAGDVANRSEVLCD
jgi:hypothetical protein